MRPQGFEQPQTEGWKGNWQRGEKPPGYEETEKRYKLLKQKGFSSTQALGTFFVKEYNKAIEQGRAGSMDQQQYQRFQELQQAFNEAMDNFDQSTGFPVTPKQEAYTIPPTRELTDDERFPLNKERREYMARHNAWQAQRRQALQEQQEEDDDPDLFDAFLQGASIASVVDGHIGDAFMIEGLRGLRKNM